MNLLDTRTVVLSYGISNVLCASVMMSLWFQYRRRFAAGADEIISKNALVADLFPTVQRVVQKV